MSGQTRRHKSVVIVATYLGFADPRQWNLQATCHSSCRPIVKFGGGAQQQIPNGLLTPMQSRQELRSHTEKNNVPR
jgi:hypothetical protein